MMAIHLAALTLFERKLCGSTHLDSQAFMCKIIENILEEWLYIWIKSVCSVRTGQAGMSAMSSTFRQASSLRGSVCERRMLWGKEMLLEVGNRQLGRGKGFGWKGRWASFSYPKAIFRVWGKGRILDFIDPSEARFFLEVMLDMEKIMEKLEGVSTKKRKKNWLVDRVALLFCLCNPLLYGGNSLEVIGNLSAIERGLESLVAWFYAWICCRCCTEG